MIDISVSYVLLSPRNAQYWKIWKTPNQPEEKRYAYHI